ISFDTVKLRLLFAAGLVMIAASTILAQSDGPFSINSSPLAKPTAPVNDYVGVFSEAEKTQLNQQLIEFNKTWGVEMAVAVVDTTGSRDIFDYSLAVARGWGIGSTEQD